MILPVPVETEFPHVLLAKFTPDVARNEPRNIGVFLVTNERIVARFLGESPDVPMKLAGRVPYFEARPDRDAYRQWLSYWRIRIERMSDTMSVADRVQTLQRSSKNQFVVVRAGFLRKRLLGGELDIAVDELYERLVEDPDQAQGQIDSKSIGRLLQGETTKLFNRTGFSERPDFHSKYPVVCPIIGTSEKLGFVFDYGLHRLKPVSLLQKVIVERPQSLNSTLFMFQSVQTGLHIPRDQCVSLVYVEPKTLHTREVRSGLKVISSYSQVINVFDTDDAERRLTGLGSTV